MTSRPSIAGLAAALALAASAALAQTQVLEARTPFVVTLSPYGTVTVLTLVVPAAGEYQAVGKVTLNNGSGSEDYARCAVALDGAALDGSVTVVGGGNAPSAAEVVTQARVLTTAPNRTVSLVCNHDHAVGGLWAGQAALVLSASPAGAKGDTGPAGARGATGPAGAATYGICVSVNATNPTSASCSCPAGKTLFQLQSAGACTAVTQSGTCSGNGWVPPAAVGGGVYTGACCACRT